LRALNSPRRGRDRGAGLRARALPGHPSRPAEICLHRVRCHHAAPGAGDVIEDKARFAPVAERVEHRKETAPLIEAFFTWVKATEAKLSAKSALAEAFRYTIKRREALTRFVTDGRLEADNNIAENAMRKIALGRRNYLFAGSDSGGERAASIYTLVASALCRARHSAVYAARRTMPNGLVFPRHGCELGGIGWA
jgi:transposase